MLTPFFEKFCLQYQPELMPCPCNQLGYYQDNETQNYTVKFRRYLRQAAWRVIDE